MRVLRTAADIAKARGDVPNAREALAQALARTAHAVLMPNQKKLRELRKSRLDALR